jgi:hypothetical protein
MSNRPLSALLVTCSATCIAPAQAQAPVGDAVNGKRVYMAVGYYQCHGTVGQGSRPTGPHIAPNPIPYGARRCWRLRARHFRTARLWGFDAREGERSSGHVNPNAMAACRF